MTDAKFPPFVIGLRSVYDIMLAVSNDFRIIENPDARAWDDFVASRGGHVLQSTAWGELKSRFGWRAHRLVLVRDEAMIAGAQILFRRLPLGLQFAYIPRGPVVDFTDNNTADAVLDAVNHFAKSKGAFALKIEPNSLAPLGERRKGVLDAPLDGALSTPLRVRGSNSIQPRTTIHLDLTRDLDTILAQMKPKWRYNIRLAERKGIVVREGNADDLPEFYRLQQLTSARDQFAIHSADYYRAAFELFTARDFARLFVAEYAGEPLAMIFVTAFGGEAIYLYGASSNAHRERMPNHALHWAAIQWAKARGCARYDLWGVAAVADALVATDPSTAPLRGSAQDELPPQHGLYQFKQGFGGQLVQYAGGYDVVFSRWQYALYNLAVNVRRGGVG